MFCDITLGMYDQQTDELIRRLTYDMIEKIIE